MYQTDSSGMDTDECADAVEEEETNGDNTARAVSILTKLLDDQKKEKDGALTRGKNELELMSNEDLDREIKELKVKKLRTEIVLMNDAMLNQPLVDQERQEKIKFFSTLSMARISSWTSTSDGGK